MTQLCRHLRDAGHSSILQALFAAVRIPDIAPGWRGGRSRIARSAVVRRRFALRPLEAGLTPPIILSRVQVRHRTWYGSVSDFECQQRSTIRVE